MADQGSSPAPGEQKKKEPAPRPELTLVVRLLLEGSGHAHGRLLLMGISLLFIGGVLTLGSWLLRDEAGRFHVWFAFFAVGAASLLAGTLLWLWKALRQDRKPL